MAVLLTDEKVAEVRERILAVALRKISDEGLAALTLRGVASELGWTAASLYRYYKNKLELVDALRTEAHNSFSDAIETAQDGFVDLWDRSRAIGDAYLDFALSEPAFYRLMFEYNTADTERSPQLRAAEQRSGRTLTEYVAEMVDAGLISGDPQLIAYSYWAAMHGIVTLQMAGKFDDGPDLQTVRRAVVRLITRGARSGH